MSAGWCNQTPAMVQSVAQDVVNQGYKGIFYWSNVDTAASDSYYSTSYAMMKA